MFYNSIYPPYPHYKYPNNIFPITPYIPETRKEEEQKSSPKTEKQKKRKSYFEQITHNLGLETDDLVLYGILLFLFIEQCNDYYLYITILLILLDIDLDNIFDII